MKRRISVLLVVCMISALTACGIKKPADSAEDVPVPSSETEKASEWAREGYFEDENNNMLSVTMMNDVDEPGLYVGCMLGEDPVEDSWGGTLPQEGNTLHGVLSSSGSKGDLTVTISEEGTDGLLLQVEGGETYHFTPKDMPNASVIATVNTEGRGMVSYAPGETAPEQDPGRSYQSVQVSLAKPETYAFAAAPEAGNVFVKWTKDGQDFSTDPVIVVLLDNSTEFVAVFAEDPATQNPVMNFVGEYQSDRAHAKVESAGDEDAKITIEWGGSSDELARWDIAGKLDRESLTLNYSDCTKTVITYDEDGEVESEEAEYTDGSGTITFNGDGTFTWHNDKSEDDEDMKFELVTSEEKTEENDQASSEYTIAPMDKTLYVKASGLNVREGYNTDGEIIGYYESGSEVHVTGSVQKDGKDIGWYQVTFDSETGYVSAQFLSETKPESPAKTESSTDASTSEESRSDEGDEIKPVGDSFTVYDENGNTKTITKYSDGYFYSSDMVRYNSNGEGIYGGEDGTLLFLDKDDIDTFTGADYGEMSEEEYEE